MLIFPAIDLYGGKAVRLYKGDYSQMTVYGDNPCEFARSFIKSGATCLHIVDLEGARDGTTPNIESVKAIAAIPGLFTEIGGGIRSIETARAYIAAGVDRIILGTAAVKDEEFLKAALAEFGEKVAVGIDIRDGFVSIKGWTESSGIEAFEFCEKMQSLGVNTVIVTDISKDGAMSGTNLELYRKLRERFTMNITASGGVSTLDDVAALAETGVYGAIIGKAYYTGSISIARAIEVAKC